jgi:hypothetical protein
METREIPRQEWLEFFTSFSREHERWSCTLEVLDGALGAQVVADGLPLVAIDADLSHDGAIEVSLGDSSDPELMHVIPGPEHVWLATGDDVPEHVIEIESADAKTLLRVRQIGPVVDLSDEFLDEDTTPYVAS